MINGSEVAFFHSKPVLRDAPINPDWILDGKPNARNRVLANSSDGSARIIVWECTAGKFNWFYAIDETLVIQEGSAIIFEGTLPPRTIKAGDVVFFPKGAHVVWHVENYVYKVAFCHEILPHFLNTPAKVMRKIYRKLGGSGARTSLMQSR